MQTSSLSLGAADSCDERRRRSHRDLYLRHGLIGFHPYWHDDRLKCHGGLSAINPVGRSVAAPLQCYGDCKAERAWSRPTFDSAARACGPAESGEAGGRWPRLDGRPRVVGEFVHCRRPRRRWPHEVSGGAVGDCGCLPRGRVPRTKPGFPQTHGSRWNPCGISTHGTVTNTLRIARRFRLEFPAIRPAATARPVSPKQVVA